MTWIVRGLYYAISIILRLRELQRKIRATCVRTISCFLFPPESRFSRCAFITANQVSRNSWILWSCWIRDSENYHHLIPLITVSGHGAHITAWDTSLLATVTFSIKVSEYSLHSRALIFYRVPTHLASWAIRPGAALTVLRGTRESCARVRYKKRSDLEAKRTTIILLLFII